MNSGLGVISSDEKDFDTLVKAYAVDSGVNGYRFRLNGAYTNEDKTAGVNLRLQSQSNIGLGYISIPYFYGWVKFLNNIFTAEGGIVDDGAWTTADFWINDDVGEGLGALLKATPITGLDLGVGAYIISQQSGSANNAFNYDIAGVTTLPDFANVKPKIGDVKYVYSGSYTLPDVFRIGASFRWKNKAGWDTKSQNPALSYEGRQEHSALLGDLRLLAVKDLTAVVAFNFDTIEDFGNKGNITFSETFGYKIGGLGLGLNAAQYFYNRTDAAGDKVDYDPSLAFNLWGSYAIGKAVPRLDLVYFLGGQSNVASGALAYHRNGYTNKAAVADVDDDYSVFGIRPSVKINFNGSTFIEIGDAINFDSSNKEGAYAITGATGDDAKIKDRLTNVFYIDWKWSF
ncbi:hypothetical protein AGMMS49928_14590 [Spirochaetia bacterium]|nr:hypothetical protein AGMMS49928_14590 [Spirochaetia bacterium]